jgi:hypothetical protein
MLTISTRAVRTTDLLYDTLRQAQHRARHIRKFGDRARVVRVVSRDGEPCGYYVVSRY